jgi:hypothetical protein
VRLVRDSKQSAKQSAAVSSWAGQKGEATVASRRLPGVAEQKVEIFCLSGFMEDRGADLLLAQQSVCHASSFKCTTHAECPDHLFD